MYIVSTVLIDIKDVVVLPFVDFFLFLFLICSLYWDYNICVEKSEAEVVIIDNDLHIKSLI